MTMRSTGTRAVVRKPPGKEAARGWMRGCSERYGELITTRSGLCSARRSPCEARCGEQRARRRMNSVRATVDRVDDDGKSTRLIMTETRLAEPVIKPAWLLSA